ncbi:MAG: efflux RND transporter periplasmic adaptor subunit [Alphaproteobacteria bacterium]|nr:efflux RND transporter periplasmic adaptor subunit [Alphaproteobacteria bacterium]
MRLLLFFSVLLCCSLVCSPSGAVVKKSVAQRHHVEYQWFGRLMPGELAKIHARAMGPVLKKHYRNGQNVKKNQILIEIQGFVAAIAEDAYKGSARAARRNYARVKNLAKKGHASRKELDAALVTCQQENVRFFEKSDSRNATRVKAPFDGVIFEDFVNKGSTIASGSTNICSVASLLNPHVELTLSWQEAEWMREVCDFTVMEEGGHVMPASLYAQSVCIDGKTGGVSIELVCHGSVQGWFGGVVVVRGVRRNIPNIHIVDFSALHFESNGIGLLALEKGKTKFYPAKVLSIKGDKVYLQDLPSELSYIAFGHGSLSEGETVDLGCEKDRD